MNGNRFLLIPILLCLLFSQTRAQSPEILGGNLLNGALTGAMLGAATMGLQSSDDFSAVRIGVGAGILGGAGIALFDLATLPRGEQLYISGVFNDGHNSSILILLDTFYGTASGAVVGVAAMLVADRPIIDGLRYGASVGAWTGFGFGLIDAFMLSDRNRNLFAAGLLQRESLVTHQTDLYQIGLVRPSLYLQPEVRGGELSASLRPGFDLFSLRMRF